MTKLQELRIKLNLTQTKMAEFVGISLRAYQKAESGEQYPSYETIRKFQSALNLSRDELMEYLPLPTDVVDETKDNPLKKLRIVTHGLSQQEMADKLGMSETEYKYIERGAGNTTDKFLKSLQSAFNIPDDQITNYVHIVKVPYNRDRGGTYGLIPKVPEHFRNELQRFRIEECKLYQKEMAKIIGVTLSNYAEVEYGSISASDEFLAKLQKAFNIPDEQMYKYKTAKIKAPTNFAKQLKELRTALDLTQKQMAKKIGIARSTYIAIEIGNRRPNPSTQAKIKKALFLTDNQ